MKNIKYIVLTLAVSLITFNCKNETKPQVKTVEVETEAVKDLDPYATYAKAEFNIEGMTCAIGCAATIQKKISKMDGVKSASVDFDRKLAMVEYDEAIVTPTSLEETVTNVADIYKVNNMKTVDAFSTPTTSSKKECSADCKKECCKPTTEGEKTACTADCKKACCTKKEA